MAVYRSAVPGDPPVLKRYELLMTTSPDQLVPDHWKAVLVISVDVLPSGTAAIRMSPNFESPWTMPVAPIGWPPSATTPTLMLAWPAHAWNARRISRCQAAVGPALEFSAANRLLVRSPTW